MKTIALFIKDDEKSKKYAKDFCFGLDDILFFNPEEELYTPDGIVCFGGDGTILRAVTYALEFDLPIISVNTGSLGFLSTFDVNDVYEFRKTISQNLPDCYDLPLYSAHISSVQSNANSKRVKFLNDVNIQRKISENINNEAISIRVCVDGKLCQEFIADGVIVSSAVGSTAYSLSAGGAILAPGVNGIIITPICPHTVSARPIVLPNNSNVSIELGNKNKECLFFADGSFIDTFTANDVIKITSSEKRVRIVKGKHDFYQKLNEKILKRGNPNV